MKALNDVGVFWLAGFEDDQLSGLLTFEPEGGVELKVVGHFDEYRDAGPLVVHGWVGSNMVTLIGGFRRSYNRPAPGIDHELYYVDKLFLGHHLHADDLHFDTVTVELSNLAHWVGDSGIAEEELNFEPYANVRFQRTDETTAPFSRGQVVLSFREAHVRKGVDGNTYRQVPMFRIEYKERQSFDLIDRDISRIQTLLVLCVDTPIQLDRMSLTRSDLNARMLDGSDGGYAQPVEYRAGLLRHVPIEDRVPKRADQMLLTFDVLGGVEAVSRWIDESNRYQRVLNSMISMRRVKQMFAENRFLNVTSAAEAFHRTVEPGLHMPVEEFDRLIASYFLITPEDEHDWLRDKLAHANYSTPLIKRLRKLAGRSAPATKGVVGDKDKWAFAVAQLRNDLAHIGSNEHQFESEDIVFLTESVYSVLRICILLECGLKPEVLPTLLDSPAHWFGPRVTTAVERVRRRFR